MISEATRRAVRTAGRVLLRQLEKVVALPAEGARMPCRHVSIDERQTAQQRQPSRASLPATRDRSDGRRHVDDSAGQHVRLRTQLQGDAQRDSAESH